MRIIYFLAVLLVLMGWVRLEAQTPREKKILNDREKVEKEGFWIYNDLTKGFKLAQEQNKPLIVVLRCVPCEECVKLDDEILDEDKRLRPLLEKFIRVRLISTNGLDLKRFQFDYDQSFAVFFFHHDGTILGRYGTRSHRTEWKNDVSIEGLARALEKAWSWHVDFAKVKDSLQAKTGGDPLYPTPEQFPTLKDKYTARITFEKDVVRSCIHCHQIGDPLRDEAHKKGPLPAEILFPYPHPKTIGLIIDPNTCGTLTEIVKNSAAEKAGFLKGDELIRLNEQPILSIADMQWVLQQTPSEGGIVQAEILRGKEKKNLTLKLEKGWRSLEDISWRASSWGLRRMATGGMKLEPPSEEDRKSTQIKEGEMLLYARHVGEYGPHAAAKNAGFRKGDFIVAVDGKKDLLRETDFFQYVLTQKKIGDTLNVTILRDGKRLDLKLPVQP
ncbi:MAG: PDZ domain-containing protein [Gemmataceae bacterium]|nr:PDZ domain-containing protein [Gemmataceae bacterium]